jgi:K+-transporting ATPase ATPase C chain
MKHLRVNLLLLGLTLAVCGVAYPLALWIVGQSVFPGRANGSLVAVPNPDGTERVIGSHQIAQKFTSDEYFWPRPSAADFNAAAGGGSNWGANSPKLRDRVAQQLGPMVVYKRGSASAGPDPNKPRTPQQDIEAWFAAKPDRAAAWAAEHSVAAVNWVKTDFAKDRYGLPGEYVLAWAKTHPAVIEEWKKANPTKTDDPKPEDLVALFFASFAKAHPKKWPGVVEVERPDKTKIKEIRPVSSDAELVANTPQICANFFDMWLQDPDPAIRTKVADLEPVPADMVTASGAGLDPHITLRNALSVYQIDRVVAKRVPPNGAAAQVRADIEALVRKHSFAPLSGLVGEPLVNVLELNIELDRRFPVPPAPAKAP